MHETFLFHLIMSTTEFLFPQVNGAINQLHNKPDQFTLFFWQQQKNNAQKFQPPRIPQQQSSPLSPTNENKSARLRVRMTQNR
jgi:hypothetical protein